MRLHFSIGDNDYRRTARFSQSIHFSITQVLFADRSLALSLSRSLALSRSRALACLKSRRCLTGIVSEPTKIRTDPPIVAVRTSFFCRSVVCVILVRQFVHLTNHFFSATQFNHGLSESCITDEPVVNAQENSLLVFLLELIRDEVLVIPFFLPVTVAVESPFLNVIIGNRKEVKSELEVLLVLFRSISKEVPESSFER